jgi:hypothetical protein
MARAQGAMAKKVVTSLEDIERVVRRVVREELRRVAPGLAERIDPDSPLARDMEEIAQRHARGRLRLRSRKEVFGGRL